MGDFLDTLIFGQSLSKTKIFFYFCLIISGGFIFRYIFFPHDIPLSFDSLLYFWYGIDMSVTGNFPVAGATDNVNPLGTNNLWPTFLSLFFSMLDSNNYLDFMFMQRNLSIFFSVLTAIPIYFLARRFFRKEIALIAPLFFIFEPRIVENSMLGITEPMFVFFVVSTLALFFSDQKKLILSSFVLAGIFCLVRYEGLMILIPMVIIMFFRFKSKKNRLIYPIIGLCIFLLVITPMSIVKIETMGYDGIFSHVGSGIEVATQNNFLNQDVDEQKFFPYVGLINLLKLFGWILIPSFFTFLPIGIFFLFKNRENKKIELSKQYSEINLKYELFDFNNELYKKFKDVDFAITRAGASTISELSFYNIPFLAIPFPYAKDDHQFYNAKYYSDKDLCWLVKQEDFDPNKIADLLTNLIKDKKDYLLKKLNMEKFSYQNTWNNINQKLTVLINEN